jgi:hypothetical protein
MARGNYNYTTQYMQNKCFDVNYNAFYVLMKTAAGTDLNAGSQSDGLDMGSASHQRVASFQYAYNGSTWDRVQTDLSTLFDNDGDNTTQTCKSGAGNLYGWSVYNSNGQDAFLQIFDNAVSATSAGTTTPKMSIFVPSYGGSDMFLNTPINHTLNILYACTTTPTGSGDPTTGLTVNFIYK